MSEAGDLTKLNFLAERKAWKAYYEQVGALSEQRVAELAPIIERHQAELAPIIERYEEAARAIPQPNDLVVNDVSIRSVPVCAKTGYPILPGDDFVQRADNVFYLSEALGLEVDAPAEAIYEEVVEEVEVTPQAAE